MCLNVDFLQEIYCTSYSRGEATGGFVPGTVIDGVGHLVVSLG